MRPPLEVGDVTEFVTLRVPSKLLAELDSVTGKGQRSAFILASMKHRLEVYRHARQSKPAA